MSQMLETAWLWLLAITVLPCLVLVAAMLICLFALWASRSAFRVLRKPFPPYLEALWQMNHSFGEPIIIDCSEGNPSAQVFLVRIPMIVFPKQAFTEECLELTLPPNAPLLRQPEIVKTSSRMTGKSQEGVIYYRRYDRPKYESLISNPS